MTLDQAGASGCNQHHTPEWLLFQTKNLETTELPWSFEVATDSRMQIKMLNQEHKNNMAIITETMQAVHWIKKKHLFNSAFLIK